MMWPDLIKTKVRNYIYAYKIKAKYDLNKEFTTQIEIWGQAEDKNEIVVARMTKYGRNLTEEYGLFIPDTWLIILLIDEDEKDDLFNDDKIHHMFRSRDSYGYVPKPRRYYYSSGLGHPNAYRDYPKMITLGDEEEYNYDYRLKDAKDGSKKSRKKKVRR